MVCQKFVGATKEETNKVINVASKQEICNARAFIAQCLQCKDFAWWCQSMADFVAFLENNDFKYLCK